MRRNQTGDGDRKSIPGRGNSMAQLGVLEEGLGSPVGAEELGVAQTLSERTQARLQGQQHLS